MKLDVLMFASNRRDNGPILEEATAMVEAAVKRGHEAEVYLATEFSFVFDEKGTTLWRNAKKFTTPDILISWVGMLNSVAERTSLLQEIELIGTPILNQRLPVIRTRDKFQTMQFLSAKGIPVIKTVMVSDLSSLDFAVETLGGMPVVVKTVYGNDGKGVAIFESERSLRSGIELMLDNNVQTEAILLQEFVNADNKDYRLFVVGDQVIAQMERSAPEGDFRSNLATGGSGKKSNLPAEVVELAVQASQALNLDISGVDILLTDKGPLICEVNPRPGFMISQITGIDVADEIVKYAEKIYAERSSETIKKASGT